VISVRVGGENVGEGSLAGGGKAQAASFSGPLQEAFLSMLALLPELATAADAQFAERCAQELSRVSSALREAKPASDVKAIEAAGKAALEQMQQVRQVNEAALTDRDDALQELATMASAALRNFKGCGDRGGTKLGVVANRFEIISKLEDPNEMRRRLREDINKLRRLIEDLGKDREKSLQVFESQVSDFRHRMEAARSASDTDPLTGVGSRRAGEKALQALVGDSAQTEPTFLVLFDVEDFGEINRNYGKVLGDQILKALATKLNPRFSKPNTLFRWGADEFLALFQGPRQEAQERGESARRTFAGATYFVMKDGIKKELSAALAMGIAEYNPKEPTEANYARARAALEQSRMVLLSTGQLQEAAGIGR
jgi:diguanylate cyclase (GGDEF)-like protein